MSRYRRCRCPPLDMCGIEGCEKRHHPAVHRAAVLRASPAHAPLSATVMNGDPALFKILPVTLRNGTVTVDTNAFIDEGSSISMMSCELADELQLTGVSPDHQLDGQEV